MRPEHPTAAQIPGLRRLWQEAFGDPDGFLDGFFSTAYSARRCLCITREDRVLAALYWLDMSCEGAPMAYIYAVATAKAYRGQGLCRLLMEHTRQQLARQGCAAAVLVPETEALAEMYAAMGYAPCCGIRELTCKAGERISLHAVGPAEYNALRRQLLPPGSLELGDAALGFLSLQAEFFAGENFVLAAVRDGDTLRCPEYLGPEALLPGITRALGCETGCFRLPGKGRPFAWWLPLTKDCPVPSHLGFAFD